MFPTQKIKEFLDSYGFTGTINDRLNKFLESVGYITALNNALYKYLGSLGYTGALPERMTQWKNDNFSLGAASSVYEATVFEAGVYE